MTDPFVQSTENTQNLDDDAMEASIYADARRLTQRFASAPVMSSFKLWPGPKVAESHYRAAVMTTQDNAAGLSFEVSAKQTFVTFYLQATLGLRFDLTTLTEADKRGWLDEIRAAMQAAETVRRDSAKRNLASLLQSDQFDSTSLEALDDTLLHRSIFDLIEEGILDSNIRTSVDARLLEESAFSFLDMLDLLGRIGRPIFLWSAARWQGTYLVFNLYKEFMHIHAFSSHHQGVARITRPLVGDLVGWLEEQWELY